MAVTFFVSVGGRFWGYRNEFAGRGFVGDFVGLGEVTIQMDGKGAHCFVGDRIVLRGGVKGDVAVLARLVVLEGVIDGALYFRGRRVVVEDGGAVKILDVRCQSVQKNHGVGQLMGSWQELLE